MFFFSKLVTPVQAVWVGALGGQGTAEGRESLRSSGNMERVCGGKTRKTVKKSAACPNPHDEEKREKKKEKVRMILTLRKYFAAGRPHHRRRRRQSGRPHQPQVKLEQYLTASTP